MWEEEKNLKNLILDLKIKKTHKKESFFTTNIPFVTKHVCKYRKKVPLQYDILHKKMYILGNFSNDFFCFYNPSTFKSSFQTNSCTIKNLSLTNIVDLICSEPCWSIYCFYIFMRCVSNANKHTQQYSNIWVCWPRKKKPTKGAMRPSNTINMNCHHYTLWKYFRD